MSPNKLMVIGTIIFLLIILLGLGMYVMSQSDQDPVQGTVDSSVPTSAALPTSTSISPTPMIETFQTPEVTVAAAPTPVVVFEAQGSIPASDQSQLNERVVNPFVDYYATAGQGQVLTLTISPNTQSNASQYPYLASAIFENGVSQGFVISRSNSDLNWWFPECMGPCSLTPEFKAKYPAIAAMVE